MTRWQAVDEPVPGHRRAGDGPAIVLLHGFTQTGLSWTPVTDHLSSGVDLVVPDAPGHGRSGDRRASVADYADLLGTRLPRSIYVGYSMGGRTALHVALSHPTRVRGLVLIGATPGLETPEERATRRAADDALARHLDDAPLDDFLAEWLAQPLFASLPRDAWNLEDRRRNTASGLAASLRLAGTGAQDSLWDRLGDIHCPTVLVTGEHDEKFTDIARRMAAIMSSTATSTATSSVTPSMTSSVTHMVISGSGHAVHLERPERVAGIVSDLVTRLA
jgi:2-succinyl-6-hydroxy-2,4-cyclohexadiene-1-carboxylate synthase